MGKGKAGCSREAGRIIMWMVWVTVWLITGIYCALAVITFAKLWQAASELQYGVASLAHNKIWRSPLSALVLSALLVFGFNMMCCVTLIKKSVNRSGPGFGYGFMVAFSISLSIFLLLSGLVLDGFRSVVQENLEPVYAVNGTLISGAHSWSAYSSQSFVGTEVLALLSFVTYLLFGIILVILQGAVSDQLGINEAAGYGAPGGTAGLAQGVEFKGVPAAPPDYDQYAQYEQYGYTQDGQQQQYYDPNAAGLGGYGPAAPPDEDQASPSAAYAQGAGYYQQQQGGYAPDHQGNYQQQYSPGYGAAMAAPPMYANTGYAAVNGFNTTSHMEEPHGAGAGLMAGQTNGRVQQI